MQREIKSFERICDLCEVVIEGEILDEENGLHCGDTDFCPKCYDILKPIFGDALMTVANIIDSQGKSANLLKELVGVRKPDCSHAKHWFMFFADTSWDVVTWITRGTFDEVLTEMKLAIMESNEFNHDLALIYSPEDKATYVVGVEVKAARING